MPGKKMKKYFSYSEYYLWNHDREKYYRRYVEGEPDEPNAKMKLGTLIHATIENPKIEWLKTLREYEYTPRQIKGIAKLVHKAMNLKPSQSEVIFTAKLGDDQLLSIFDGYDKPHRILDEFKTTDQDRWYQWNVDGNEQLSFYAMVYFLKEHKYFMEMRLHQLHTVRGTIKTFRTIRSRSDIDLIMHKVTNAIEEIKRSGLWDKRKSRKEIALKSQGKLI